MSTCRHCAPLMMAILLANPARAQIRVTPQWLYPVETVFAADFLPYSVGQQPDFLGITLMNGAASQQTVVLELIVRQERPSSRLLFEGSTDPFVLRGSVRRITNKDLASQNSDVSIRNYDIASAVEDLSETIARTGRLPSGTYVFQARVTMPGGLLLDEHEVRVDLVNPTRLELLTPGGPFGDQPEVVNASAPRFQWSTDEALVGGSQQYRIRVVPADDDIIRIEIPVQNAQGVVKTAGIAHGPSGQCRVAIRSRNACSASLSPRTPSARALPSSASTS